MAAVSEPGGLGDAELLSKKPSSKISDTVLVVPVQTVASAERSQTVTLDLACDED